MKTVKNTLLFVALIVLSLIGALLLFGEPVPGDVFDSFLGLLFMKALAIVAIIFSIKSWYAIDEDVRNKIESWIRLHF